MPKYILTYFDGKFRGEPARLMFAAAKKTNEYEDKRISFSDWPALKPKTRCGTLPVLEKDGNTVAQSMAINRYLAREFGFYGKDNLEALYIDEIADTAVDLFQEACKPIFAKENKDEVTAKFQKEIAPKLLGDIEKSMTDRGGKAGFAIGSKLSLADIMVYNALDTGSLEDLSKFPRIKASKEKVLADEGIKKWLSAAAKK